MTNKYQKLFEKYEGKVRGKWYRMRCPFHKESDASLDVDLTRSGFHCWGCSRTGNHKELIMRLEGISSSAALRLISKYVRSGIPAGTLGSDSDEPRKSFLDSSSTLELFLPISHPDYKKYLKGRKIPLSLAARYDFRQGSAIERGWNDRIIYPIRDIYGNLCSVEGRTIVDDKLRYRKWKGSSAGVGIFGIDMIPESEWGKPLIIVEGAFDTLSIILAGKLSVGMSCSEITKVQIRQLKRVTEYPIVILDGVKPGTEKDRLRVLKTIQESFSKKFLNYKVVEIPYKNTDPNDLHRKGKLKQYLRSVMSDGTKGNRKSKATVSTGTKAKRNKNNSQKRVQKKL